MTIDLEEKKARRREYERRWCAENPDKVRAKAKRYYDADPDRSRERAAKYRAANPGKGAAYMRQRRADRPEIMHRDNEKFRTQNPDYMRDYHLKRHYGITGAEFEAMSAAQYGRCALCRKEAKLVVDHCHKTGRVRGLLCAQCNHFLGLAYDDVGVLGAAARYVARHNEKVD